MNVQFMVGVTVLAVGSAVAMVASGGSGSAIPLPLPQAATGGHGSPPRGTAGAGQSYVSAGAAGLTGSVVPSGADPSSTGADGAADQVFAMASAVALTGCTVSMSNPAPLRGQTAETATVNTTTGAEVRLEADYLKARSVHSGIADGTGTAYFTLAITHAEPGVTVRVAAAVSLRGAKDSCSTSFTPVYPAGILPATGGGQ